MKRYRPSILMTTILCMIMAGGFFIGCKTGWIHVDLNDAQETAVKAVARPFGSEFAKKNPDLVLPATLLCEQYVSGELSQDSIDKTAQYISDRFSQDEALSKSAVELLGLLKAGGDDAWDIDLVHAAAEGFLDGMAIASSKETGK